ncbi:hypothetical protein AALO_G00119690 [Alosa alosa]|uniref:Lens epithelium-derived growth factor integrase-binding domain-containing protein n=1 Tax=Alosa alosa TaxID=278164 RepID=A0AAV6GN43_9TELE|nr:hypothetical protein AALO_G00119690 [Alosa alosa]
MDLNLSFRTSNFVGRVNWAGFQVQLLERMASLPLPLCAKMTGILLCAKKKSKRSDNQKKERWKKEKEGEEQKERHRKKKIQRAVDKPKSKQDKSKHRPKHPPEKENKKKEPSPEEKLQKLHTDIKFALKVDSPDIKRCLQALTDLESVQVTSAILQKNSDVITTLKKIRRYKASTAIMEKASEVYNKLKLQFVGKGEPIAKTQLENQDDGGTEPQLQDLKPVNGESESLKKNVECDPESLHAEESPESELAISSRPESEHLTERHILTDATKHSPTTNTQTAVEDS